MSGKFDERRKMQDYFYYESRIHLVDDGEAFFGFEGYKCFKKLKVKIMLFDHIKFKELMMNIYHCQSNKKNILFLQKKDCQKLEVQRKKKKVL